MSATKNINAEKIQGNLTGMTSVSAISLSGGSLSITGTGVFNTLSATTYQNLPTDIRVTGATYSNNTFTYTNNTGGTFNVLFNTMTGLTVNGNLNATTISATTYQNLPPSVDTFVTGFTYNNNTFTILRNQGQPNLTSTINTMTGLTVNGNLSVTGNTNVRGITGTTALFSGSAQNVLTVYGSGSTSPIFTVQGSSGELFSVTDSLTGSLFSINDISGLPIFETFSDNTILMGSYLAPSLNTTSRVTANSGLTNIYSIPTSAYTGAFYDYTVNDGSNARAGNVMAIFSGSSIQYTETSTLDIGNTSGITMSVIVSGTSAIFRASATTNNWTIKSIIRGL